MDTSLVHRTLVLVLLGVAHGLLCSDAAKHDALGERVAAEAVRAVESARDFASGKETADHRAVGAQHLRVLVRLDAT